MVDSASDAYDILMSPTPYTQASAAAMLRNFGAAAALTAQNLRQSGARANTDSGSSGYVTQQEAERHAAWFAQVSRNANDAAGRLDTIVAKGHVYQANGAMTYQDLARTVDRTVGPDQALSVGRASIIRRADEQAATRMSQDISAWGSEYGGFKAPTVPPLTSAGGAPSASGAGPGGGSPTSTSPRVAGVDAGGGFAGGVSTAGEQLLDRGAGAPGSIEVGPDGGDFAGWYKDPRSGYYVDPGTGREFDPASQRWVDPVTGQPFGDVARYATGLQGLGPASITGGLLSDTAGFTGGATGSGSFAGLFPLGNTAAIAAGYGGTLPPSLASGSAAAGSLWQQASRALALKQGVSAELIGREQAARAGRPYTPPMQAGLGAAGADGRRGRPSYLTADEEEAALFSGPRARRSAAPTTVGTAEDESGPTRRRRSGVTESELFDAIDTRSGVLGE